MADPEANDDFTSILPKAIAGSILKQHGAAQGTIRLRAHYLPADRGHGRSRCRTPHAAGRIDIYEAQVFVTGNSVELLKKSTTLEVAPVATWRCRAGQTPRSESSAREAMIEPGCRLFRAAVRRIRQGWTRFWFTPSDPATLSAMRLLIGAGRVYLHATLSFDLVAFFGPNGLLPTAEIAPLEGGTFSYLNYLVHAGRIVDGAPARPGGADAVHRRLLDPRDFDLGAGRISVRRPPGADDHRAHRADRGHAAVLLVPGSLRPAIFARSLAGPRAPRRDSVAGGQRAVDGGHDRHAVDSGTPGAVGGDDGFFEAHRRHLVERHWACGG